MSVEVRKAEQHDVDWLIGQLRAFEKFVAYKRPLFEDEIFARDGLAGLVDRHVVLIAHDGKTRQGFIAGTHAPHPFNPRLKVLTELFWWVSEEFRMGRAGFMLLDEFEIVGRAMADWVVLSLEHNSPVRETHLTKRGFRQVERAFLLEV